MYAVFLDGLMLVAIRVKETDFLNSVNKKKIWYSKTGVSGIQIISLLKSGLYFLI